MEGNTAAMIRKQISEEYVRVGMPLRHSQPQQPCGFCLLLQIWDFDAVYFGTFVRGFCFHDKR